MENTLTLENIKETAKDIIETIRLKNSNKAAVITFSGDLGAGKTTLTKAIASNLGIKESVVSPTFVIMKIYQTKDKDFKNLVHIDAYRLEKDEDLIHLGWSEIVKNKENLVVVEWPEMVPGCFDGDVYRVDISHKDENTRTIKFFHK